MVVGKIATTLCVPAPCKPQHSESSPDLTQRVMHEGFAKACDYLSSLSTQHARTFNQWDVFRCRESAASGANFGLIRVRSTCAPTRCAGWFVSTSPGVRTRRNILQGGAMRNRLRPQSDWTGLVYPQHTTATTSGSFRAVRGR